jgi:hypothetical protein
MVGRITAQEGDGLGGANETMLEANLALAEEDDVAAGLRDEELKNAASQIRTLSAAAAEN